MPMPDASALAAIEEVRVGERLDRERLGEPGHAFDQQVPLRENRDQHPLEEVVLADDDLLDLVEDALHLRRCPGAAGFVGVHRFLSASAREALHSLPFALSLSKPVLSLSKGAHHERT